MFYRIPACFQSPLLALSQYQNGFAIRLPIENIFHFYHDYKYISKYMWGNYREDKENSEIEWRKTLLS